MSYLEQWLKSIQFPASILYKSTAGRYRPVSFPDGPITAPKDLCRLLTGFTEAC